MMNNMMEKAQALMQDQVFAEKLDAAESTEEMLAVMAEYDLPMTADELKAIFAQCEATAEGGELSEEALDNVSGGGFFSWLYSKFYNKNRRDLKKLTGY